MLDRDRRALALAAAHGALTGLRTTGAWYTLSRRRSDDAPGLAAALRSPTVRGLLAVAFATEGVVDKMPWIPPRTDTAPLTGRIVVAAIAGVVLAEGRGASRLAAAAVGGATAAASAFIATRLRRLLTRAFVPDVVVGLAEDAVVVCGAYALRDAGAG